MLSEGSHGAAILRAHELVAGPVRADNSEPSHGSAMLRAGRGAKRDARPRGSPPAL